VKRAAIVGIAVAGAVVIAGAGAMWWALSQGQTPEEAAASSYLDALANGNLETIQAMREPLPAAQERTLEDAFLSAAGYIGNPIIEDLGAEADGTIDVRASVDLGGKRHELRFALEDHGSRWVIVDNHVGSLTADATFEDGTPLEWVLVGEVPVPSSTAVSLLPAEYVVAAAPRGVFAGSAEVAIIGGPVTVSVAASVDPAASDHMQQHIDAYADGCAEPAATVPDNCGIVVPWAADLASLERMAFRIEQYPALAVSADGGTFDATGGVLVATAYGMTRDGTAASFTYRAEDWALRGTVTLAGDGAAVLSVR
jgi:hypothetical protein